MTDEEIHDLIHKISDMISLNNEEIEQIKTMDVKELIKIVIILIIILLF